MRTTDGASGIAVIVVGKFAVFYVAYIIGNRARHFLSDMRVPLDELRSKVFDDAEQVIDDEYLSVT